jgi:hypothetical protein
MSLTLNTTPVSISNSAAFNVATSLSEDSSHVNLRVRADIYHEGIVKATVERPKGLADFDFGDILKSLTPGLLFARDSGDIVKTGSIGSNLITDFPSSEGTFDTLTVTGEYINAAVKAAAANTFATSNNITVTAGDIYLLFTYSFNSSGANSPYYKIEGTPITQRGWDPLVNNKGIIIIPTANGTINIKVGHLSGGLNFNGYFYLYKITTNRTTIGSPLAPYFVNFTEVYENSSGVTTTGATSATQVFRYVPAKGDGVSFAEYVLHDEYAQFANKTINSTVTKFFTATPYEYWKVFFTEYVNLELFYSKDGGAYNHATHPVCYEGWGVVIINVGELMATVATSLIFYMCDLTGIQISIAQGVYPDTKSIDERVVLEFDGLVGGKEYLAFEGLKDQEFTTIRNYFSGSKKNRKLISADGICRQTLETLFKDQANTEYLKSLLISDNVKRLEASYATPTDVTVVTDGVTINKGRELFTNQIQIEYEY